MITTGIAINSVNIIRQYNQAEIQYGTTVKDGETVLVNNALSYRVFEFSQKEDLVAAIEAPEHGGKTGDSAPYLTALGW